MAYLKGPTQIFEPKRAKKKHKLFRSGWNLNSTHCEHETEGDFGDDSTARLNFHVW